MADEGSWRTPSFRQSVVQKIDEAIRSSGMSTSRNSLEMESHVFQKAKTKEEYLGFVARLILHVREMNTKKGPGLNQPGGQGGPGMQDPINALQNLASQGSRNNQMMGIGPGPGPMGGPQQVPPNATNLLQTLNRVPNQMNAMPNQMQPRPNMMGPNGGNIPNQMGNPIGQMSNPNLNQIPMQNMNNPLQQPNQMGGQMPGQMPNQMGNPMQGGMGMGNQIPPLLQSQMLNSMQLQRKPGDNIMMNAPNAGFPRNPTPNAFLTQSPTQSVQSPAGLSGPPNSNQMVASPALAPSPSSQSNLMTPQRSVGMAPSPSSSLNTPGQPNQSPMGMQDDVAYREKVRQLSKYIEPLRKMIARMGNDGEHVEKTSKMKKLLEILSNPQQRMPLETLLKCEVVLEKLDFKRGEGGSVSAPSGGNVTLREHHAFNPLLEAISNNLQSPVINHTLHRTFGPTLEALFSPEIKNSESTSAQYPPPPRSIAELYERIQNMLQPYHTTIKLVKSGNHSAIIFTDIEFVKKFERSRSLYVDETFRTNRQSNKFHQMTISSTVFGQALPVLHVLTEIKSLEMYQEIFRYIKTIMPNWCPRELIILTCDYNNYLQNVIVEVFPEIILHKTIFDYCKTIFQMAKNNGILEKIRNDSEDELILKQYLALPLLPTDAVEEAITCLSGRNWHPSSRSLFSIISNYFTRHWIRVVDLSQVVRYEKLHYINESQEPYHLMLNMLNTTGIYKVIANLMKIDLHAQREYRRITDNPITRVKPPSKMTDFNLQVSQLWGISSKTIQTLLLEASHFLEDILRTLNNYNGLVPMHQGEMERLVPNLSVISTITSPQPSTSQQSDTAVDYFTMRSNMRPFGDQNVIILDEDGDDDSEENQTPRKVQIHNWKFQREDEEFIEDKDDEARRCPICLENRRRYALTCGHIFCGKCSMHIYNFDGKCALCRVELAGEPIFLFMG